MITRLFSCETSRKRASRDASNDIEKQHHCEKHESRAVADRVRIRNETLGMSVPEMHRERLGGVKRIEIEGRTPRGDAHTRGIDERRRLTEDTARDEDDARRQRRNRTRKDDAPNRLPLRRAERHRTFAKTLRNVSERLLRDAHERGKVEQRERERAAERGELPPKKIHEENQPEEAHHNRRNRCE